MDDADVSQRIEALILEMRKNGVLKSTAAEAAFRKAPRHLFLPNEPLERAYQDIAIPVKMTAEGVSTSSSSQPTIMAIMLEQLELRPGMRVLEIGAGTGYNAALMAELVGESGSVIAVDIQPDIVDRARENLDRAGYERVQVVAADGGEGWPGAAPYDRIILTASSWVVAPAWREQLAAGGRLLLPLALLQGPQKSIAFERRGDELASLSIWDCGFMPLQGAFGVPAPQALRVGPAGRLALNSPRPLAVEAETLSAWLGAPGEVLATGVKVLIWDLLGGFLAWQSARSPEDIRILSASGDAVQDALPLALLALGGRERRVEAFLQVLPGGAAALVRPPDEELHWHNIDNPDDNPGALPFEVCVRQLGPDPAAARHLAAMVQAWDAAGRPDSNRLRVRGLPAGSPLDLGPGEFLVERPWTWFVVSYVGA